MDTKNVRDKKDLARLYAKVELGFTNKTGFEPQSLQFVKEGIDDKQAGNIAEVMKSTELGTVFVNGGLGGQQMLRGMRSEERIPLATRDKFRVRDLLSLNAYSDDLLAYSALLL